MLTYLYNYNFLKYLIYLWDNYIYKSTIKYQYFNFKKYLTNNIICVYTRNLPLDKLHIHFLLYVISMVYTYKIFYVNRRVKNPSVLKLL